jgi:hypothetical protein
MPGHEVGPTKEEGGMVITLPPELEAALKDRARQEGATPEALALAALRERFLVPPPVQPGDEWERRLLGAATDCGVSLPHSALGREGLYE